MKLYDYFRSSACYRVRIALNIKQCNYEKIEVHLINNGGEQHHDAYREVNPQELVPALEINNQYLTQSLAIIDYLEETHPTPALLPQDALIKAKLRSLALTVACDMHPLNNMRVLNQLKKQFSASEQDTLDWYHHWLKAGFDAFESQLHKMDRQLPFCYGSSPSLADICLIPQVYNANRFNFSIDAYPLIKAINEYCLSLDVFSQASPGI